MSDDDLLSVEGLQVSYEVAGLQQPALRGISFRVQRGSTLAIVGESGSGKSTLAHAMIRLLPPNASIEAGAIKLEGRDLTGLSDKALQQLRGLRVGFVPQDPSMSLNPTLRIGSQVAEALALHEKLPRSGLRARVLSLLSEAGLPDAMRVTQLYPHELSGGMRQRVLIAIAFALSPPVIIADEPTSALDATVANRVLDHLGRLVRDHQSTLVIITHDLALAARRAKDVIVMSEGRIVESGPAEQVLADPHHEYTRKLVSSSLHLRPRRPRSLERRQEVASRREVVVSARQLTKQYPVYGAKRRPVTAVDGVSFDVVKGSTFALVGESGSGKSTTVRMVLGLEAITGGQVQVFGKDVASLRPRQLRDLYRRMQVIYQNPYASLDPRFTIGEIVEEPLRSFKLGDRTSRRTRVAELIDRVGLPRGTAMRKPKELSGGQRQRVAIARALAVAPDLVICDEPVSALDASVQAQVLDLLVELQRELGVTYIFISHDLAVVADIAHTVGIMQAGHLVEAAPAAQIFSSPQHEYTRSLLEAAYGAAPNDESDRRTASDDQFREPRPYLTA